MQHRAAVSHCLHREDRRDQARRLSQSLEPTPPGSRVDVEQVLYMDHQDGVRNARHSGVFQDHRSGGQGVSMLDRGLNARSALQG